MELKEIVGPIQEDIEKVLGSTSQLSTPANGYQLDQELLQSLWYSIAGTQKEQELQSQILPFFHKPNFDEQQQILKLLEVLEYLYSKYNYAPLLKALSHSTIYEFLKNTALSVNASIRDKALLCIYLVSSKLKEKSETAPIVQLQKDLLLLHDIVYTKPTESIYFNAQRESEKTPNKRPLTSRQPGSSRFDNLFREARISDSSANVCKSKDLSKEISQEGELSSPLLLSNARMSIEDYENLKRDSIPQESRSSSTLDTALSENQVRDRTNSNKSGSPIGCAGHLINEINQPFDLHSQSMHTETQNPFEFSRQWNDQRIHSIRNQGNEYFKNVDQQKNLFMTPNKSQFGGSFMELQAIPSIDFSNSDNLGFQNPTANAFPINLQQYDHSATTNPITGISLMNLLNTSEKKKFQGSMSLPMSTRNSANQPSKPTTQPKSSLTDQQKSEGIVLTPKDMERISQRQNPAIGNLPIKELLDYKKSSCSDKECCYRSKITSMELFLGKNEAIACRFFHNNTDQRRFPLHKHNLLKSFYKHDKLCGDCFVDPKVHNGRCYFSRNWFEVFFHPKNYKIYPCSNQECEKKSLRRKYCPLYHDLKEREDWDKLLLEEFYYDRRQSELDVEVIGEMTTSKTRNSFPHQESSNSKNNLLGSTSEGRHSLNDVLTKPEGYSPLQINSSHITEASASQSWEDISRSQSFQSPGASLKKTPLKKLNVKNQEFNSPRIITVRGQSGISQFPTIESSDAFSSTVNHKGIITNEHIDTFISSTFLKPCFDRQIVPENSYRTDGTNIMTVQTETFSHSGEKGICESYIRNTKLQFGLAKIEPDQYNEMKNYEGPVLQDSQWEELTKIVGSFLNAEGGKIYLGVDSDGVLKGVQMNKKEFDAFEKKFVAQMLKNISPKVQDCYYRIKKVPVVDNQSEKLEREASNSIIIEITVNQGDKIFFVQKEEYQVCYQRSGALIKILKGDQINQLMLERPAPGK